MDQLESYKQRIHNDFPEVDVKEAKILSGGMDHIAIETDGHIFRLPKQKTRGLRLAAETTILRRLQKKLPVAIPNPTHIATYGSYFGYPKLSGEIAAEHSHIVETSEYISQWVEIVQAIHESILAEEAITLGLTPFDRLTHFGYYERTLALSRYDNTTREIRTFAERTLDRIRAINLEGREQLFLHNDFHAKNVLVDPESLRITGLIDWSDMIVGPVECDFWVWEWGSPESLEHVAELYTQKTGRSVNLDEARTWLHLGELADYYDAIVANDAKEAAEVLAHIHRWIGEGK